MMFLSDGAVPGSTARRTPASCSAATIRSTWTWQFSMNTRYLSCVPATAVPATSPLAQRARFLASVSLLELGKFDEAFDGLGHRRGLQRPAQVGQISGGIGVGGHHATPSTRS